MLEMIFAQILKMSLTAGACIVVVSMLHLVFHRIPRKYLYALWIVVAFRLVCPVSVSTPVGLVLMGNVGQIEQTSVTDELVQKMASPLSRSSSASKVSCFTFMSSNTASMTRSAVLTSRLSRSLVKEMRESRSVSASSVNISFSTS